MIAKGLSILACLALLGAAETGAQDYPRKPITVVVPFAAGGPTDTVARLLGVAMGKSLKTQIIVENVGGAGMPRPRPSTESFPTTRWATSSPSGWSTTCR